MGIKHKTPKISKEKGWATEWNDDHKVDSDIDFAGHSGYNVGEPINPSDIATKNYVDSGGIANELGGIWTQIQGTWGLKTNETKTLLNYSGSGWLFGLLIERNACAFDAIITIDGIIYKIIPSQPYISMYLHPQVLYNGLKKFNSQLKIEIKDTSGASGTYLSRGVINYSVIS